MEMMIAIVLVGMALTISFAALRFAARSWERADAMAGELDQLRIASSVMRRQLSQVQVIRDSETNSEVLFAGTPRSLEFVAPAPFQDGRLVALYRYRFRLENGSQGKTLWLDYRPYLPGEDSGWSRDGNSSMLASELRDGRFAYFGDKPVPGGAHWQDTWDETDRLPGMVRMAIQPEGQSKPWPAVVILLPASGSFR